MTSENSSKISDMANRVGHPAGNEPGSEQAMFIEKLRSAAQSATDRFSRTGDASKRSDEVKVGKCSAVQDILQGFKLDGVDTA
jgi:hypothetical protein